MAKFRSQEFFEGVGEGDLDMGGEEFDTATGESVAASEAANEASANEARNEGSKRETEQRKSEAVEASKKANNILLENNGTDSVEAEAATEAIDTDVTNSASPEAAFERGSQIDAQGGSSAEAINKVAEAARQSSSDIAENAEATLEENDINSSGEYKDAKDNLDEKIKNYKDALEKKGNNKGEIERAKKELEDAKTRIENSLESAENTKTSIIAKGGNALWNLVKALLKNWKVLALIGGAAGLYNFLKHMTDENNGCYKWVGTDSSKINCGGYFSKGQHSSDCGCGPDSTRDLGRSLTSAECSKDDTKNMVYCNRKCTGPPLIGCSKNLTADNAIFYAAKDDSPLSILTNLYHLAGGLPDKASKGITKLLIQILKWAGIVLAIIFILAIISSIYRHFVN
jgi:tetratricopeptide (TPR) repeat protein